MGQSQSQPSDNTMDQVYSDYIKQQQNMIMNQQQQINDLYQMNLNTPTPTPTPTNIVFQQPIHSDIRTSIPIENTQQTTNYKSLPSTKLNPYKILGLPKQYNESMLKKAYLKIAMKTHPDRGGSKDEFQKVSIAYTLLKKKLKEEEQIHHHNELKGDSNTFIQTQSTASANININNDNFDSVLFNKIYEENRIGDVYDNGYGEWIKQNNSPELSNQKMFQGNFNKDLFNHEFEKYKQVHKKNLGSQLVQYEEPQVRLSMKNQDSLVTLGEGRVTNFSGESNGLNFTDYRAAFTTDSTLIDSQSVDINGRAKSIDGVKGERTNISYKMSIQDQHILSQREAREKQEERLRVLRLQRYDQKGEDMYNKVNKLLLR